MGSSEGRARFGWQHHGLIVEQRPNLGKEDIEDGLTCGEEGTEEVEEEISMVVQATVWKEGVLHGAGGFEVSFHIEW